jgi:hypothetical protein
MGPIASLNTEVKRESLSLPGIELQFSGRQSSCSLITVITDVLCLSSYIGIRHEMRKQWDM